MLSQSPNRSIPTNRQAVGLATPQVLIEEQVVCQNLDRLAKYAASHGLKLRPHAKTHKSLRIAQWQLERGAVGLTVAKPGEAAVFGKVSSDLLLAYPVVDAPRAERIAKLSADVDMKVAVDSAHSVATLSAAAKQAGTTIGILVDLDVGLHRTGVPDAEAALALAQVVDRSQHLTLRGLLCYPGHVWDSADSQAPALRAVATKLEETLDGWRRSGLRAEIVSGGSTPTAYQSHLARHLTEIRPGTYLFNDMNTVHGGYATLDDCAARIVTTVVSDAVPEQVVIDAGSKTLAADRCISAPESGHGYVVEYPEARVAKLSEEHGQIDVSRCGSRPHIGELLTIIPNHICPCINLQNRVWLQTESGEIEPLEVEARGQSA